LEYLYLEKTNLLKELGTDGRIILQWIIKIQDARVWPMASSCEMVMDLLQVL
jgi:hypothetical protein